MKFLTIKEILEEYQNMPVYYDANAKLSIKYKATYPNSGFPFAENEMNQHHLVLEKIKTAVVAYRLSDTDRINAETEALKILEERDRTLQSLYRCFEALDDTLKKVYISMCDNQTSPNVVIKLLKSINPKILHDKKLFFTLLFESFAGQYDNHIANLMIFTLKDKLEELEELLKKEEEKREADRLKEEKKQSKKRGKIRKDFDEGPEDERR